MSCHCGCNNTTTPTSFSNVDISGASIVGSTFVGGTISGSNIDGYSVDTIAALRALAVDAISLDFITVLGYWAAGDGGGGEFWYDSTSVAVDNGGTVIAPNSGVGRWIRL